MFLLACHSSVADGFTIPPKSKTLLQILVEELPKRGGWPEGVTAVTQDSDAAINKYKTTHGLEINTYGTWKCSSGWQDYLLPKKDAPCLASDYATAIIIRDQYEAALFEAELSDAVQDKPDAEGWIEWAGGECPVNISDLVDIKLRCGDIGRGQNVTYWRWDHIQNAGDIIAYRLHQPQDADSRANDDRLEADLNDCIGQAPGAPQWDGQGMPPVGVEFNYGSHRSRAKCLAVGLHYVFASKGNPDDEDGEYEELMIDAQTEFHPVHEDSDQMMRDIMKSSRVGAAVAIELANQLIAAGYRKQ